MKAAKDALKAGKEALEMEKAALFQTVVAKTIVPSGVDPKSVLCEFYKAGKVRGQARPVRRRRRPLRCRLRVAGCTAVLTAWNRL